MIWRVQISGKKLDLEALSNPFTDGDLRLVAEDDKYFLESKEFESTSDADEVLKMAGNSLAVLSGVARLAYGARTPLTPGHILRINQNSQKDTFISLTDTLHVSATIGIVKIAISGESEVITDTSAPIRSWVRVATNDVAVSKALRLFGSEARDWVGLYRLLEVIEGDVGGIREIVAAGWATGNSLELFGRTANSVGAVGDLARHGKERTQPPETPMSLSEATSLVEVILHNWLRVKGKDNT